jgi:putative transcriptional regulator
MGPGILIASPQMKDPNFEGTVILLCQHNGDGALGVIVNRPTPFTIGDVVDQLDVEALVIQEHQVLWGGPVERGVGFVIFSGQVPEDGGWNLPAGVAVSPSRDQLMKLIRGQARYHLCLGYAGWGPGQLDAEIATGSWLYTDVDPSLVLTGDVDARYDSALRALGLQASMVWMTPVDE